MRAGPILGTTIGALLVVPMLMAPTAQATNGVELAVKTVPYAMDSSNQAGWWHPLAERGGDTYLAFNAPSSDSENRHQVHLAKRSASGRWSAGCLRDAGGTCAEYVDDIGHNQPSIAIDGDGYIHAFVSMHNDQWRYFRSADPEAVTTMVDRSTELPDQQSGVTYPVTATAPNGDVYLMARVSSSSGYGARLYRWRDAGDTWQRVAVVAQESGFTPYPDDLEVDVTGRVHILWEWARGGPSASRYYGSYLVYEPRGDRFVTAGGQAATVPATTTDAQVVYEPDEGVVQSARFTLVNTATPLLAGIAYRYRPPSAQTFDVRWASWEGAKWVRETVDSGFASPAAIAATHHGGKARIYYIKQPRCDELALIEQGGLFVAEKRVRPTGSAGEWQQHWLGGAPGVERLSTLTRRNGTDVLYLAAPNDPNPTAEPALHLATLPRGRTIRTPAPSAGNDRANLAYGAQVSVTSNANDNAIGACAVDGISWADHSRWISAANDSAPTITIDLAERAQVGEVRVYSGHQGGTTALVTDFVVEARVDGQWREIGRVSDNPFNPAIVVVPEPIYADQVRLRMPSGVVRIYEVEIYSTISSPTVGVSLAADPAYLPFPGDTTELRATLINRTPEPVAGTATVELPAGWTAEPAAQPYQLDPHGQATVTYAVSSPADAPSPAAYELTVRPAPDDRGGTLRLMVRNGIVYSSDRAPRYIEAGSWAASSLRGHEESTTRFTNGGSGATATWTPELRQQGTYRVHVWHPTNPDTTAAAEFTVVHARGVDKLVVNQRDTGNAWHPLGTWEFDAGTSSSVTITSVAPGYHRAGAVWFEIVR